MLVRKIPIYNFKNMNFQKPENTEFLKNNFYIRIPISHFFSEQTIFEIPGALKISVIKRSYTDNTTDIEQIKRDGGFYFNENNELLLEAQCHMKNLFTGKSDIFYMYLPLSAPFVKGDNIGFYYDGTWFRFMKEGEVLNQNSGFDCFCEPTGEISCTFDNITVSDTKDVTITYREEESDTPADFYFPYEWNTSVGDVMTFYHDGVYHLIYLHDRRHHGSRNGHGAHYITQLTTTNLIDWYEQVPIASIDKPWKSFGTGTMLFHKGKYYMSFGLHTERYQDCWTQPPYDEEQCEFIRTQYSEFFEKGEFPAGAAYSISNDGIVFTDCETVFHASRNPSAYTNEKGGITLYGGYNQNDACIWESESFDKPFKKIKNPFIFYGDDVAMKNSEECPAFFSWNGYKYLLVGFSGYYRTLEPDSENFVDATVMGENIYDGMGVPMVAEFGNNRRIIAGWIQSPWGWGGALIQRELIFEEGGKLGIKWIPELAPTLTSDNLLNGTEDTKNPTSKHNQRLHSGTPEPCCLHNNISLPYKQSYLLTTTVIPKNSKRFSLLFSDGVQNVELQLNLETKRAQFNNCLPEGLSEELPTHYEQTLITGESRSIENQPFKCKNYSVPDVVGMDEEFTIKIISRYSPRMRSTVYDVEIAERNTMLSVRENFYPTTLRIVSDNDACIVNSSLNLIKYSE